MSIPFTWLLPEARRELLAPGLLWDRVVVGGPAVELMPDYLRGLPGVQIGTHCPGVLQRVNPQATRTSFGCPRKCRFCAIGCGLIGRGEFVELDDWPDLPVIIDENILATSPAHFERVIERLAAHGWCDFNQGLDARLLTPWHARLLKQIRKPMCRLALDDDGGREAWERAYGILREAGIAKARIRTYALIGFRDTPATAWARCRWVEEHGVKVLPMWYHALDAMTCNVVTGEQTAAGWSEHDRRRIMRWYYKHTEEKGCDVKFTKGLTV